MISTNRSSSQINTPVHRSVFVIITEVATKNSNQQLSFSLLIYSFFRQIHGDKVHEQDGIFIQFHERSSVKMRHNSCWRAFFKIVLSINFKNTPLFKIKTSVATRNMLLFKFKMRHKSGFWCHFKVEIA